MASKLDVKVAKAAFYPSLTHRCAGRLPVVQSQAPRGRRRSRSSTAWRANLMAPLLNRAAITAYYRSANARQLQAVFNYEKTLLQAFTDVATQLAMIENLKKGYELQAQQVDTLAQSVEVSNLLFRSARADYMEVLLTRRDSLEARDGADRDEEAAVPGDGQHLPGARRGMAVRHLKVGATQRGAHRMPSSRRSSRSTRARETVRTGRPPRSPRRANARRGGSSAPRRT